MATTNCQVSLFIQVPDEGETEAWQIEQALRDAVEEHLWAGRQPDGGAD